MELQGDWKCHCWAEVDLDALRRNFAQIRQQVKGRPVCAVIKADAYGHGDLYVAKALAQEGVAWFAVSSLPEAIRLREAQITQPILILGYTPPGQARIMAVMNITQAVFSLEYARALSQALAADSSPSPRLRCHLKADTGMGRIGFDLVADEAKAIDGMRACFSLPGLKVTGLFQHFAVADSTAAEDLAYTEGQHALFCKAVSALREEGHRLETVHCCNSAGQATRPDWAHDLVRAGIILYGYAPSIEAPMAGIEPILTVKALVSQVKTIHAGQSVSYGRTFTATQEMRVATVSVGYADGYPRALSGQGVLAIRGQKAPVVGRVCMDQLLADVSAIPGVQTGDVAVVFGPGGVADTAEDVARKAGTIHYEILCGLSRRVPRVYLDQGAMQEVVDYLA